MSDLNDLDSHFPHQVCVNLDQRPERWERVASRFRQHGFDRVLRFRAVDGHSRQIPSGWRGSIGAYGCLQSNVAVVRRARAEKWPRVLIFEDDVVFPPDVKTRFSNYIGQVPRDWDMLFFGAMHLDSPSRVSENVARLTAATSTYAYALNESVYDAFIELNERSMTAVDLNNLELQKRFACFCFLPHLVWVESGQSDTEDRAVNPWWLEQSLVMGGLEVSQLAERTAIIIANPGFVTDDVGRRNEKHVAGQYLEFLPGAVVYVVRQSQIECHDRDWLPQNAHSVVVCEDGPFDRGKCFNAGLRHVDRLRQFFVFADRDICPGGQVKAVLMMCRKHDFVSSFAQVIDLSHSASERLIADGRGVDYRGLPVRKSATLCSEFCAFTRAGIDAVGGWATGARADIRQSEVVRERLSVFCCPGWSPRLNSAPEQV